MLNKKKKPKTSSADIPSRIRGFILDSQIQNPHELSEILGCTAISDEVAEREEEESDLRIAKIEFMIPLIYAHVHLLAEGAVEYQKNNVSGELKNIPNEVWSESRKMMEQVSLSAVMGSVSQLVDMGFLEIPRKHKK